ncbi:MAG: ParB/RepB/Spo0J family partition protein, partial [Planctomycetota bacterium]|nr:ParB/RepB/Spo0J family partition protein [Planctomycetota bacterium]
MPTPNNTSSDSKAPVRKLGRGIGALISVPAVEVPVAPKPGAIVEMKKEVAPEPQAESADLVRYIDVGAIATNPFQPRKVIHQDTINQLAESIKHSGLMQPIIVRPSSKSGGAVKFELVAGERRWRAGEASSGKGPGSWGRGGDEPGGWPLVHARPVVSKGKTGSLADMDVLGG